MLHIICQIIVFCARSVHLIFMFLWFEILYTMLTALLSYVCLKIKTENDLCCKSALNHSISIFCVWKESYNQLDCKSLPVFSQNWYFWSIFHSQGKMFHMYDPLSLKITWQEGINVSILCMRSLRQKRRSDQRSHNK